MSVHRIENGIVVAVDVVTDKLFLYDCEYGSPVSTFGSWTVAPTNLENLIDNNDATATGEGTNSNDSLPSYIIIDTVMQINVIKIEYNYNSHYTTSGSGNGYVFMDISLDGVIWKRLYTSPDLPAADTNYNGIITIGRSFRYIRMGLFANTLSNTYTGHLTGKKINITGVI